MADELRCPWIAVNVETSHPMPELAQARLSKNLDAARLLGAEVVTTSGEDIAEALLRESPSTQSVLTHELENTHPNRRCWQFCWHLLGMVRTVGIIYSVWSEEGVKRSSSAARNSPVRGPLNRM
jgi:K+-sensing histidine kinase KdpD